MKRIVCFPFFIFLLLAIPASAGEERDTFQAPGLTLDAASRMAIAKSLGIQIFRQEEKAEAEEMDIARALYDTEFFFNASYTRDEKPASSVFAASRSEEHLFEGGLRKIFVTGTELEVSWKSDRDESNSQFISINPSYDSVGEVSLEQPLFENAFGLVDQMELDQVALDIRSFNYLTLQRIQDALFEARQLFWKAREAYQILMIAKRGLKDAWTFHKTTLEKFELGLLEDPERFASEANVKSRQIEVLVARNRARDAENDLKRILTLPLNSRLFLEMESLPPLAQRDPTDLVYEAMSKRYDRNQALLEIQKQDLAVRMAEWEKWPRLDLKASLALNGLSEEIGDSAEAAFDGETPTYFFGLEFEWPFENREARGRSRQAKFNQAKALLELDRVEDKIEKEVDEVYREVLTAHERWRISDEVVRLQSKKLFSEMRRFGQGRSSSDLIIDYQRDYLRAQESRAEAMSRYGIALDEQARSTSSLLDPYLAVEESST